MAENLPKLPPLPTAPTVKQPSGLEQLGNMAGLFLIASSRPELLPQAAQKLFANREEAEREAELRFQRELELTKTAVGMQQAAGAEARAGRQEQRQEKQDKFAREQARQEFGLDVQREQRMAAADAAQRAHQKFLEEMAGRQLEETQQTHSMQVLEILSKRYDEARESVESQLGVSRTTGQGRLATMQQAQQLLKSDPLANAQYRKLQVKSGQAAADQYLAGLVQSRMGALGGTAGPAPTTTEINRRTIEVLQANPIAQRLMKEANLDIRQLIPAENLPARVGDLPPEQIALVADLTMNLAPKMLGGTLDAEAQARVAASMTALGMTGNTAALVDRVAEAITLHWEQQFGLPREEGEQLLADMINDNLSLDAIEWQGPPPLEREGFFKRALGAVPPGVKKEAKSQVKAILRPFGVK